MSKWNKLRKHHNLVKIKLISEFKGDSLFDVSVGRGGDISKWSNSDIRYVVGIDPFDKFIKEARRRLDEYNKFNPKNKKNRYRFYTDTITNEEIGITDVFHTTSCQFSLHYFFETDEMLENAVRNIAKRTSKYFIGTTIIGSRLKDVGSCDNEEYSIELHPNYYYFKLKDSEKSGNYFNENDNMKEYYVDFEKFENLCKKYGFKLIKRGSLNYDVETHQLEVYEMEVTSLYDYFVFEKVR